MSTLSPHCSSSFHSPRHLCPSWGLASHHQRPHRACHITGQWQLAAYMMVSSRRRGEGVHTGGSPRVSTTGTGTRGSKTGAAELETSGHWEEIRTGVRGRPDFWRVSWAHGGGPAGLGAKETPGTWARSSGKRPHHTGVCVASAWGRMLQSRRRVVTWQRDSRVRAPVSPQAGN